MSKRQPSWSLRFLRYVGDETDDGCILWTGPPGTSGYGSLGVTPQKTTRSHRLAYELVKGPIPRDHHVHHICGNKLCVNAEHLRTLTISEHSRLHGRPPSRKGTTHTPETKAKMSAARKGLRPTPETRKKLVAIRKQWWANLPPEQKAERMARMRARKHDAA